jgi:hypothetical protein
LRDLDPELDLFLCVRARRRRRHDRQHEHRSNDDRSGEHECLVHYATGRRRRKRIPLRLNGLTEQWLYQQGMPGIAGKSIAGG